MKNKILLVLIATLCVFLPTALLRAQTPTPPTLREVLDDLALPPPPSTPPSGAMAGYAPPTPPDALFSQPASNPLGKLHRGTVLYAAAGRARELRKPARAQTLALAAKDWLLDAAGGLSATPAAASRCWYYLGMIAENYEGSLTLAIGHFQQAVTLDAGNAQAARALERLQALIPPAQGQ